MVQAHLPTTEEVRALRAARKSVEVIVPCRHSAEQLWPYMTQVDLYNRASGASAVEYEIQPDAQGRPVIRGIARKLGFTSRYSELPYEWHALHFVHGELFFDNGPLRYGRIRGEYLHDRRAVRYVADYVPRNRFLPAGLLARGIVKRFAAIFRGIDERLPEAFSDPIGVAGFADRSPDALSRARTVAARWSDLASDPIIADAVAEFVMTAPDRFVGRMRPYALARQLGTTRRDTLEFCLRATKAGFLELRWDLVCPSCNGAKQRAATLEELGSDAHCDVCNVRYDADLERNVEVSFRPTVDVRQLDEREYCLQSPSHQRQILTQVNIEPRTTVRLPLDLTPGPYRFRCIGAPREIAFEVAYGRPRREVHLRVGDDIDGVEVECGGSVVLVVENASSDWRTIRFERHGYRQDAATAAEVTALPEYRERFAGDAPFGTLLQQPAQNQSA